ncbi:F-box only protein 27-like isoform X2 [Melanaphis sacchari]|uniref:F-box only protein 27-like isoform X2 n=1 Tax=Melanaphis sacchari TaxID=742174 RepID=UPI000DC143AD|nr:F-box only protein 27-like isoform X2 [Melanaphis sacchari]
MILLIRLVCKRWQELIDAYVFQEKASRENKFVNNGKGYYSFSKIDSNNIRKLELPWYVFHVICKYDPFNRNLVKNHCGQNAFMHWSITNDHNWWTIEENPQGAPLLPDDPDFDGHTSCFVSTYRLCSKRQKIIFKNYGLNDIMMKTLQPEILVSEWYTGRFDCGCKYALRATVHDGNDKLIEQHNYSDVLPQWEANIWTKASHSFKNQSNASYLILYHSGVDTQYWAGHYGTKISGSVVKVLLPIKFKCANS